MFQYCEKCIQKHKGKICECEYPEVEYFIALINQQENKQFQLVECPDENCDSEFTVDLHFKDLNTQEDLWLEIKEVILSMTDSLEKANNRGQELIEKSIDKVLSEFTLEEYDILSDYCITIPFQQFGGKDIELFEQSVYKWLFEFITGTERNKFEFTRSNGQVLELSIEEKSSDMRALGDNLLLAKDAQPFDNIGQNMESCTDLNLIGDLICDNIIKTDSTNGKFPKEGKHRILLNILRFSTGMEIFWNIAHAKGFDKTLISYLDNAEINDICNITEIYLLYYMQDYYESPENAVFQDSSNVLICYPIIKGIIS